MTGYQKLKKENEILWQELEKNLRELANLFYSSESSKKENVQKEIAWIKMKIKDETK